MSVVHDRVSRCSQQHDMEGEDKAVMVRWRRKTKAMKKKKTMTIATGGCPERSKKQQVVHAQVVDEHVGQRYEVGPHADSKMAELGRRTAQHEGCFPLLFWLDGRTTTTPKRKRTNQSVAIAAQY